MKQSAAMLQLPALRAKMGDWIYYSVFMKMGDIAERVSLAEEIHSHKELRDLIQRSVDESTHAEAIKKYLLTQEQRFFNALVIGVYGGDPDFYELTINDSRQLLEVGVSTELKGALGILRLTGGEKLFAIDGQHRVVGIKKAVQEDETLKADEVVVLLVGHKKTDAGMERSRRLFTTLNRYAKPVSKADIIALDEDDVVAILTRMLVEQHPFFSKFLLVKKGKAIPATDKKFFTTLETLYDVIDELLKRETDEWRSAKKFRPSDHVIKREYQKVTKFWNLLITSVPALSDLQNSDREDEKAAEYRNRTGGHLLYRPAGLMIVVDVVKELLDAGFKQESVIQAVASVPMQLTDKPWAGLLWDTTNRRMISSGENRILAWRLLLFGLTGDVSLSGKSEREMRSEWAGISGKPLQAVTLPQWTHLRK